MEQNSWTPVVTELILIMESLPNQVTIPFIFWNILQAKNVLIITKGLNFKKKKNTVMWKIDDAAVRAMLLNQPLNIIFNVSHNIVWFVVYYVAGNKKLYAAALTQIVIYHLWNSRLR